VPIRKELRPLYKTPEYKAARAACRERAGDRCEQCGGGNRHVGYRDQNTGKFVRLTLGNPFPPVDQPTVKLVLIQYGCAHLDNNPANNAPENTAWLCRGCHLHRDAPFHRLTRATRKDAARPAAGGGAGMGRDVRKTRGGRNVRAANEGAKCQHRKLRRSED
jgi:hypothetical protein